MMMQWRESGTEAQKQHAGFRLAQPDAKLKYPSLFQQAVNASKAVGSVVASAIRGESVTVPQEEQDRRLAICLSCDKYDPQQHRCRLCGCFANLKVRLAGQHCPDDPPKW